MPNPLAKAYDCDAAGCAGNAQYLLFLETYEQYKFFACPHCVSEMKNRLGIMAESFKVKVRVEPIKDIIFKLQ